MKRYNPQEIEKKWQATWDKDQVYKADLWSDKPKYIAMSMFNYPSGAGIHIGHAMNYTISDVMARYKRQNGYESYHPVGWDSFGLPAENYAIKTGVSPQASMAKIIPSYHSQYKAMGWSNDWSREIATHEPLYYKWTQWIFSQMYKNGLAYQDVRMQWWCTKCQTVLSNEQVIDGKCWRHDAADDPLVEKKEIKQWFFKITDYADDLLEAIDELDWSDVVKSAQKNWIGRSVGAEVEFKIDGVEDVITVFTTRPDTLFGVTFVVLAPEHDLALQLATEETKLAVEAYVKETLKKSELERQESKDKTGVFTGSYVVNPANGEKIPVWIADYVLGGYGTGAIMGVPAHDERDYEFAEKFGLEIKSVVAQDFGERLEDAKEVEGVVVIGYDPRIDKYLSLDHKGKTRLVSGGRDGDESFEHTAYRELAEEAGYAAVEAMIPLGVPIYSYYTNPMKGDRRSLGYNFLAIIDSTQLVDQHLERHEEFSPQWHDFDTLISQVKSYPGGCDHWIEGLLRARAAANAFKANESYVPELYHGEGVLINSGVFNGKPTTEAREEIVAWLEHEGTGRAKTTYKLRDWSVSRQRYWGAPIPIVNCEKCGQQLVPDDQLPVVLPELVDFAPSGDGRSALGRATEWLEVECPKCGGKAERETDTLDTYICSSWYFFRYFDPRNEEQIFDPAVVNKWMPIDFYNGADHATAHMIYARFITRFFHTLGLVSNPEPFKKFLFNGKVTASDGTMFSKSKGNGVDPLEIINQGYGADALRTYLMFAAPLDVWAKWDPQGVPGTYRFLSRIWNLVQEYLESGAEGNEPEGDKDGKNKAVLGVIHPAIRKVTHDLEEQKYNTAIAALMKATNDFYEMKAKTGFVGRGSWQFALESLVSLVAPFAPHIADELWQQLGRDSSVQRDSWPQWDDMYLQSDTIVVVVQVNGKLRAKLEVSTEADEQTVTELALADENIRKFTNNKKPAKVVYVPGRLVNIVL